LTLTHGCD